MLHLRQILDLRVPLQVVKVIQLHSATAFEQKALQKRPLILRKRHIRRWMILEVPVVLTVYRREQNISPSGVPPKPELFLDGDHLVADRAESVAYVGDRLHKVGDGVRLIYPYRRRRAYVTRPVSDLPRIVQSCQRMACQIEGMEFVVFSIIHHLKTSGFAL